MTVENNKDILSVKPFRESLIGLSNLENPTPLKPENIDIFELKNSLINSGIKIDLIENNPELITSIQDSKFRSPDQGKGPAVIAVLGQENYQKYFDWAMEQSTEQPRLKGRGDETRCRGLMQFMGQTISLAVGGISVKDYCDDINSRALKTGFKSGLKLSTMPDGSAIKAYEFILSLNK